LIYNAIVMPRRESPELEALKAQAEATLPESVKAALRQMDNFEYQDENGVDLTLIRENLKLTPTERLERNLRRRREVLELRKHVRRIR
jgi:hypothetical protein